MPIHLVHHYDRAVECRLDRILGALTEFNKMFQDLETKVGALKSASDSAEALLDGIKAKLDDIISGGGLSAANKAKLDELSAAIDAESGDLAAAVERNTPAEEPPVEPPVEEPIE